MLVRDRSYEIAGCVRVTVGTRDQMRRFLSGVGADMEGVIVFDMDGVLVDVSQSYRETIRETVRHFGGPDVSHERIQDYKNSGGWNNDLGAVAEDSRRFGYRHSVRDGRARVQSNLLRREQRRA